MEVLQRDITVQQNSIIEKSATRNVNYVDVSSKIIGFAGVTFAVLLIVAAC